MTVRDGDGRPLSSSSQPAMMAVVLERLGVEPGQRVLEIGTGYDAALLSHLVGPAGHVVSLDIDQDIAREAHEHLARSGIATVETIAADGADGRPSTADLTIRAYPHHGGETPRQRRRHRRRPAAPGRSSTSAPRLRDLPTQRPT